MSVIGEVIGGHYSLRMLVQIASYAGSHLDRRGNHRLSRPSYVLTVSSDEHNQRYQRNPMCTSTIWFGAKRFTESR